MVDNYSPSVVAAYPRYGPPGILPELTRGTPEHAIRQNHVVNTARKYANEVYLGGWLLFGSVLLCLAISAGLSGGAWSQNTFRSQQFENYMISLWVFIGLGILLAIAFMSYFLIYFNSNEIAIGELERDTDKYRVETNTN